MYYCAILFVIIISKNLVTENFFITYEFLCTVASKFIQHERKHEILLLSNRFNISRRFCENVLAANF